MSYQNNIGDTYNWLEGHKALKNCDPLPEDIDKLNRVAELCMSIYKPQTGDKSIVGWFIYTELFNEDGTPHNDRDADGICYVAREECAIGLSKYTLQQSLEYCCVIGLHELTHVRFENHDDDFTSYNLQMQHDLLRKAKIRKFANFFRLEGKQ